MHADTPAAPRRPATRLVLLRVVAVLVGASACSDFRQVAQLLSTGPAPLAAEHLATGLLAAASALGLWRATRWGAWTLAAWGVATALLLGSLTPLLGLPPEAALALRFSAAGTLVVALLLAWWAHGVARRAHAPR